MWLQTLIFEINYKLNLWDGIMTVFLQCELTTNYVWFSEFCDFSPLISSHYCCLTEQVMSKLNITHFKHEVAVHYAVLSGRRCGVKCSAGSVPVIRVELQPKIHRPDRPVLKSGNTHACFLCLRFGVMADSFRRFPTPGRPSRPMGPWAHPYIFYRILLKS